MDLEITGKIALVCGSSSGLGLAVASRLASEGCSVVMNARDEDRLQRSVKKVKLETGGNVVGFPADVSSTEESSSLVKRVIDSFGAVDILLCNAGGPPATSFADTPHENWQKALDLNLISTISLCRSAIPSMRERRWGRVICLTSVAAKEPLPGLILSTTARAGVLGFAKSLSDELAYENVTVNVVCPGYMQTERVNDLVAERSARENRPANEILSGLVERIPMGRMGKPEELAAAVAFLSSQHAEYITGVALQVDGGYIRNIC